MLTLQQEMMKTIGEGLLRASVTTCSRWASKYRYVLDSKGNPITINYDQHPWTKDMRDCNESWTGPKAAQMGFTEVCLDRTFFTLDVKKQSVLYLLPKKNPDASDFSAARFSPALELSPHLSKMFDKISNIGHKRAGAANLYIRGTQSKSAVKSVPVSLVIYDEKDEMNQANIAQAQERLSGQDFKQDIEISTPTVPEFGISENFPNTNQQHFFFTCPHCSRKTELVFPDDLVVTADSINDPNLKRSHYVCHECKHPLDHKAKTDWLTRAMYNGRAGWEATANKNADRKGFYINQFYSLKMSPVEEAAHYIKSLYDVAFEQEWWNSKGGLPHAVQGAKIDDVQINNLLSNHKLSTPRPPGVLCTMGVDQGKWIYYHIDLWYFPNGVSSSVNTHAIKYTIGLGKVTDFEDLDKLMVAYQVNHCVIDANPERRKATEFKERMHGHVHLCFYNRGITGREIIENEVNQTVSVDRTSWLDCTFGRFQKGTQRLPMDIPQEYREHLKAPVRMPGLDTDGNPTAKYINTKPDHFAHACNYSEIALPIALSTTTNVSIKTLL